MDLLGACQRALRRPVIQGSMGTKKWSLTTARVLNRLRKVSNEILDGQPTEHERACVNRVWPFVGVERREYPANGLWENIKPQDRRDGVRRQLKTRFSEGAFAREGKAAREAFTPDDLLAWGDQLLAEDAANAAVAEAELEEEALRLFAPEEHEGDEAAEAAPASAPAAANVNPDTTIEPDDAMECDSREESADGRGAGPPPGVEASASIIPVDVVAAAAVAPSVPLRRAAPFATRTLDEVSAVRRRIVANFEASPVAVPPPGAEAPPSISSEDSTSLRRSVRKGFARRTGRSGFFSGKGRLTAEAVASLNSCPSSVASNANHNRTATSFTQSRSDRSPWDRISYHSSQLSAKLARSFPSRKKAYVRPPSVLADELDEIETWQRIDAKVIEAMRMREKIVGRDSTLDAVEREDRISEEAKHKTIVDEMREVMDAVELGDCELAEQRVDSLQMHLHTQLSTSRITRKVRDAVVELKDLELKDCEFAEQRIDRLLFCWSTVMLSAREQGPLSTLDAMEFSDRRGTAMADEP